MPVDVTATATIDRPREEVAVFLRDPANDTTWIGGLRSARLLTPPPVAVGSRVERVASFLGRRVEYVNEITELDGDRLAGRRPPRRARPPCGRARGRARSRGQAVVDQAQGGGAGLLDQIDLDGRAPRRHAKAAVLPAIGEGDGKLVRTMRFTGPDELEAGKADLEAAIRAWCDWKAASSMRR